MDARHAEHLKPGVRVAVFMGGAVHEITGGPPVVTTATVMGLDDDPDTKFAGDGVWLAVDIAVDQTLPQRYRVEEVIGFLMPMAVVEHHADGSITGTFPSGTVTPDGTVIP